MIVYLVIGTIAGILLGLRFKILVLVPAILLATIFIIASGHELKMITLSLMGTVVLIQIGYFVGSTLRAIIRAHLPARSSGTSRPPGSQTGH